MVTLLCVEQASAFSKNFKLVLFSSGGTTSQNFKSSTKISSYQNKSAMDTQAQEVMQEFVEGLKEAYKERQLSSEEQWPPVRGDKLIKLQLVEANTTEGFRAGLPQHGAHDDKVKRTPILHGDLFKVEEGKKPVRKLIIEGNAGIGKTTLCTMLTEEWANGEILTQFDCVLLLPLRDQLVSSASSLSDLLPLYHPDETVCGSVVQQPSICICMQLKLECSPMLWKFMDVIIENGPCCLNTLVSDIVKSTAAAKCDSATYPTTYLLL